MDGWEDGWMDGWKFKYTNMNGENSLLVTLAVSTSALSTSSARTTRLLAIVMFVLSMAYCSPFLVRIQMISPYVSAIIPTRRQPKSRRKFDKANPVISKVARNRVSV